MADLASTRVFGKLTVMHDAILRANAEIVGNVTATKFIGDGSQLTALPWGQLTGVPSTFSPSSHTHPWGDVTGAPATATRWPTWSEVTGKPATFAPSTHNHDDRYYTESEIDTMFAGLTTTPDWTDILNKPATATRWPAWGEVTGKPSTFTPSSHGHAASEITGLSDAATTSVATIRSGTTKANVGLSNVRNVSSYSQSESDSRYLAPYAMGYTLKSASQVGYTTTAKNGWYAHLRGGLGSANLTFDEAVAEAASRGVRLPTVEELEAEIAKGTGGGFDSDQCWTSTAVPGMPGYVYTVRGDGAAGTRTPANTDGTATAMTRYVANVDTPPVYAKDDFTDADTPNAPMVRNSAGDVWARLFRSSYTGTNSDIAAIYTTRTIGGDYMRPSTPAQVKAALNISSGDVSGLSDAATTSVATIRSGTTKANVGLSNVDNYSRAHYDGRYATKSHSHSESDLNCGQFQWGGGSHKLFNNDGSGNAGIAFGADGNTATETGRPWRIRVDNDNSTGNFMIQRASAGMTAGNAISWVDVLNLSHTGSIGLPNSVTLDGISNGLQITNGGNGNVVIGNRNTSYTHYSSSNGHHYFYGQITSQGNITAYSDRRVKKNLEVIPDALDKVAQLAGYTYDRIDEDTPRQTGVIAQEVQEVLPEAVVEDPETGHLHVAYGNLAGLLIEALKEERSKREALEDRLAKLEAMMGV